MAQRLDVPKATLMGEPVTLADRLADDGFSRSAFSVAATGLVAYRTGTSSQRRLNWIDRSGVSRGTIGDADANLDGPRLTHDGRRVAVGRTVQGDRDLWLLDGARASRVTFDPSEDRFPIWSPDDTQIVFRSARTSAGDLYRKLASGAGVDERLLASDQLQTPTSWSPDGRFLLYHRTDPQTNADLWVVPMVGNHTPSVFLKTPFREAWAVFSRDGRWVAYQSDESGQNQIYVQPFPDLGAGRWQVSPTGGAEPAWARNGRELFYLDGEDALVTVPIQTQPTFGAGTPTKLFDVPYFPVSGTRRYDVAPDGQRFMFV